MALGEILFWNNGMISANSLALKKAVASFNSVASGKAVVLGEGVAMGKGVAWGEVSVKGMVSDKHMTSNVLLVMDEDVISLGAQVPSPGAEVFLAYMFFCS